MRARTVLHGLGVENAATAIAPSPIYSRQDWMFYSGLGSEFGVIMTPIVEIK